MQITIKNKQSVLDIAIQACGSAEAAFTLAFNNGCSVSDELQAGTVFEFSVENISDKRIATVFSNFRHKPATELSDYDKANISSGGIDFMGIEIDFMIS